MGFYHNTTYTFNDPRYPGRDWIDYMNNSIKELIDLYHPSVLWGDVTEGPVKTWEGKPLPADYWNSKEVLAYFYNHSPDPAEVVANDRWGRDTDGKMVGDYQTPERTAVGSVLPDKWEECDSLDPTSWGYNRRLKDAEYMTPNEVVDYLVDIVSKNGNLLMNIGPRSDGTIPSEVQNVLLAVGDWLKMNGEAIYGTRAWISFGEGPTQVAGGSFHDTDTQSYTPEDFRFTSKSGTLYAIEMAWPANGRAVIHTLTTDRVKVGSVVLLATGEAIPFKQTADGLQLQLSSDPHGKFAYAYKITLQ